MLPDYFGSDVDYDTAMGHGADSDREPYIIIVVDSPAVPEPRFCTTWDQALRVLTRFDDHWQVSVHVGSYDIEVYVMARMQPEEIQAMTGTH